MATKTKSRKSRTTKARYIGKPADAIQVRVKLVGPEHLGIDEILSSSGQEQRPVEQTLYKAWRSVSGSNAG